MHWSFTARNLSSKHRTEVSINEATSLVGRSLRIFRERIWPIFRLAILNASILLMDENTSNALTLFVDVWYVRFIGTLDLHDACFEGKCEQSTDLWSLGIGFRSWSRCEWERSWMSSQRDWSLETWTSTTWLTDTWTCFLTANGRCIAHLSADGARNRTVRQRNHVGFNYTAWSTLTYTRQSKAGWFLVA